MTSPAVPPDVIRVGHVLGAFGVQGAVRLYVIGDPARLVKLTRFFVEGRGWLRVKGRDLHGPGLTVTFSGVQDRDAAERLRSAPVFAHEDELPPLPHDEFYYHELRGLPVRTPGGELIGEVRDVQDAGPQDLLLVSHANGDSLVPLQAPYVEIVRDSSDPKKPLAAVILDAPPGLLGED
ncbi:ribosome maturation factor RimM [Deinococcus peraridilitoris]|uniref:Ribosome maturation factor RimM n=1 Tax=Deinococcus peraridilitoris (strain DSM 19664 / LMG 22246 / CIP 109416 / KR-200) TaxID=937777 RepID=K9ZW74_DEIPD|nr:ribosome maturation factor RimM [Deinococcus peraridilitoris]AFZ65893.1 16S rRNA processing protein RimM [Deinococcus peraridilitoris DSM 19664]